MSDIHSEKKREKLSGIQRNVNTVENRYNELAEQLGGVKNMVRNKTSELFSISEVSDISQSSSKSSYIFYSQNEVIRPERIVITENKQHRTMQASERKLSELSTIPEKESTRKVLYTSETSSINNIISGITNSVNKLTNLEAHLAPVSSAVFDTTYSRHAQHSLKKTKLENISEKPYTENSKASSSRNSPRIGSSKTPKKIKKKIKTNQPEPTPKPEPCKLKTVPEESDSKAFYAASTPNTTMVSLLKNKTKNVGKLKAVSSKNILIKKPIKPRKEACRWNKSHKIVELYHNAQMGFDATSKDNIDMTKPDDKSFEQTDDQCELKSSTLPRITETRSLNSRNVYRNYTLPTIATKMKQVAKNYENFCFRTIPFVAAKSLTPSHNIGVNLQQMLSIIKGKKPLVGISRTLAHNIVLAINKENSKTLLALLSEMLKSQSSTPSFVQHNLEDIQEEPEQENEENNNDGSEMVAGDKEGFNKEGISLKDTTLSKATVELGTTESAFHESCVKYIPRTKSAVRLPSNQLRKARSKFSAPPNYLNYMKNLNCSSTNVIEHKRNKSLKEVLKNLYDDFARLNQMHDELNSKVENQTIEDRALLLQQLQHLEQELQAKEDEITIVMDLYKEVITLKQQVKTLKRRASQPSIIAPPFYRQRPSRDTNPAVHLAKLLKYVQQFQTSVNSKPAA